MATKPPTYQDALNAYLAQPGNPGGRLEFWRIGDIKFVPRIQRDPMPVGRDGKPSEKRIKTLGGSDGLNGFDPNMAGVVRGAILTDGPDVGAKVLTDGLGRKTLCEHTYGDDYILPTWVRELTEVEAAEDFLEYNGSVKKPTPYDHYQVSEVVDEPVWAALRKGLSMVGVEGAPQESGAYYGDGDPGRVTAIAALKRVAVTALKDARAELDEHLRAVTDDADLVDEAAARIAAVLRLSRDVFVNDPLAHDADLLQALARLYSLNGDAVMQTKPIRQHLEAVLRAGGDVTTWRQLGLVAGKSISGGSVQRSVAMSRLIGMAFNGTKMPKEAKDLIVPARDPGLPLLRIPITARKK